jgi:hypothetical protein
MCLWHKDGTFFQEYFRLGSPRPCVIWESIVSAYDEPYSGSYGTPTAGGVCCEATDTMAL